MLQLNWSMKVFITSRCVHAGVHVCVLCVRERELARVSCVNTRGRICNCGEWQTAAQMTKCCGGQINNFENLNFLRELRQGNLEQLY